MDSIYLWRLPRRLLVGLIRVYQRTLSFDHSPLGKIFFPHGFCRFQPTCSDYGVEAISKYGVFWGGLKTIWRILRCNPLSKGGPDPVK